MAAPEEGPFDEDLERLLANRAVREQLDELERQRRRGELVDDDMAPTGPSRRRRRSLLVWSVVVVAVIIGFYVVMEWASGLTAPGQ